MKKIIYIIVVILTLACRVEEEGVIPSTTTTVTDPYLGEVGGMYLLNEGNMGSNKSTLDYFDITTGKYHKNIYAERNPSVIKELGDVGNDLQAYDGRLYAVINCSNLVEVMSLDDATHLGEVAIPNCRYIVFEGDYGYVSSYQSSDDSGCGDVYKIKLDDLTIVGKCQVGYQPDQMVVKDGKLYVTSSVKYDSDMKPTYDNRVMVVNLSSFEVQSEIEVAINLHQMVEDSEGKLWVSSRGDYADTPSQIYRINPTTEQVTAELDVACSSMTVSGEYLYIISSEYSYTTMAYTQSWAKVHTPTESVASRSIITDGSDSNISQPYSIAINPETEDIYITDAKAFVVPGTLHCYSPTGELQWSVTTGDIPSKMVFTDRN